MRIETRHNIGISGPRNRPAHYSNFSSHRSGHHRGGSGKSSPLDCLRYCICVFIFIPIILFIVGIAMISSDNNRVERIGYYNTRAKEWNDNYASLFQQASFSLADNSMKLKSKSSEYFPVADACSSSGDPEGGCIPTVSHSFLETMSITGDSVFVNISNSDGSSLFMDTKDAGYFVIYDQYDMNCKTDVSDSDSDSCYHKCMSMNGEYNDWRGECKVAYSLVGICIRVEKNDRTYLPSSNSDISTNSGCYYSSDFSPFIYAKQWKIPSSIPVEVRHHMDPVISASLYTRGCSDSYIESESNHKCFGLSRKEQDTIGYVLIGIGVVILISVFAVVISLCTCCISLFKKTKTKSTLPESQTTIPIAEPVPSSYVPQNSAVPSTQPFLYPQQDPYGQTNLYGQTNSYGQTNPYDQPRLYY